MGGRLLDWLGAGIASSLPDPVADMPSRIVTGSTAFYWATDTKHLFVYDPAGGPAWFDIDMAAITAVSTESIQDMIATFLTAGTGITLTYNDAGNLLTIAGTVTQYTDEMAQDAVAAMIAAGTDTGLTIVYNDAGNAIAFTITVATASDIWGGTLDTAFITPKRLKDWRTPVSVADAATITLDGSLGANFYVTLGGNRILANPTNFNPGQFGVIHVTQDGTGTRTLTFGANWKFGSVSLNSNVLTTTAGAVDAIHYYVRTDGTITCFIISNLTGSPAKLALDNLSNVAISSPANGDVLTYDTGTGKWKNAASAGGGEHAYEGFGNLDSLSTLTLLGGASANITLTAGIKAHKYSWTASGANTLQLADKAQGAGAFNYYLRAKPYTAFGINTQFGFVVRNSSTGKVLNFTWNNDVNICAQEWTNPTTFSSNIFNTTLPLPLRNPLWLWLSSDGTTLTFSYSTNGVDWETLGTRTIATFMGSIDRVGLGGVPQVAGGVRISNFGTTAPS